jgi:hypothetical protein
MRHRQTPGGTRQRLPREPGAPVAEVEVGAGGAAGAAGWLVPCGAARRRAACAGDLDRPLVGGSLWVDWDRPWACPTLGTLAAGLSLWLIARLPSAGSPPPGVGGRSDPAWSGRAAAAPGGVGWPWAKPVPHGGAGALLCPSPPRCPTAAATGGVRGSRSSYERPGILTGFPPEAGDLNGRGSFFPLLLFLLALRLASLVRSFLPV